MKVALKFLFASLTVDWKILLFIAEPFFFFVLQYLLTHFSDFQLATLGSFIIHESVFFLSGLPSVYFERSGLFSKYKIQVCVRVAPLCLTTLLPY